MTNLLFSVDGIGVPGKTTDLPQFTGNFSNSAVTVMYSATRTNLTKVGSDLTCFLFVKRHSIKFPQDIENLIYEEIYPLVLKFDFL